MARFKVETVDGTQHVIYKCPGCKHLHTVPADRWNWNGDVDKPTLSPSVRHFITFPEGTKRAGQQQTICHYFIRDGRIEFCGDCEHDLKGSAAELPEIE